MEFSCPMHGGFMAYGWLLQLLIFAAFFFIVWWLIKKGPQQPNEKPLEIRKKRLAKGEITKKEFEELKKEL